MLFVSVRDIDGALALLMLDEYFAQSKLVAQLGVPVLIIHVACTQVGPGGAGQGIPDAQLRTLEGLVWGHTGCMPDLERMHVGPCLPAARHCSLRQDMLSQWAVLRHSTRHGHAVGRLEFKANLRNSLLRNCTCEAEHLNI